MASGLVGAYVLVGGALGAVLLAAPQPPDPVVSLPEYTHAPPPAPSNVAWPVPEGYERVIGPHGMEVAVPQGWVITRSSGPGAVQATDPADPTRFVRYGGSPAGDTDLLLSHVEYEGRYAARKPTYQRLSLGTTVYHEVPAVDWEFTHDSPSGPLRAHSMYWRVGGVEYFVYAASDVGRWAETREVYQTMIDNVSP